MTDTSRSAQDPLRLGTVAPSNVNKLNNNNNTQNSNAAALRGAALAFGKPPVKPKPKINDYAGTNGALAAATKVGRPQAASRNVSAASERGEGWEKVGGLVYQNSGSSVGGSPYTGGETGRPGIQQRLSYLGGPGLLHPPGGSPDQGRSTSFIAATLAASRSTSLSPNPTGQSNALNADLRRPVGFMTRSPSAKSTASSLSSDPLDTTSIPPTTSLIGMFEQNAASKKLTKRPSVKRSATATTLQRVPVLYPSDSPGQTKSFQPSPLSARPTTSSGDPPKLSLAQIQRLSEESEPKKPPPPTRKPSIPSKPIPIRIPTQRKPKPPSPPSPDEEDASSDDSFVSASDYQPSFRAELAQRRKLTSASTHSLDTQATIDSMANAIVASSLASSRAASPSKSLTTNTNAMYPPLPPPPRRHQHRHFLHKEKDRTPSPAKPVGLRMTMRKEKSHESLDEAEKKRSKKKFVKKHPNKHHEGDRKRWRDALTERERKRYEAVWASNKGIFSDFVKENVSGLELEKCVCSLVVRDIFSRSRLGEDVLEEVYALVDRGGSGWLEREEFVVGLWLIDQRLKGRKLPVRVSDHVWKSVGVLAGIKVKKAGK